MYFKYNWSCICILHCEIVPTTINTLQLYTLFIYTICTVEG